MTLKRRAFFLLAATLLLACCTSAPKPSDIQGKTFWTLFDSLGDGSDGNTWQMRFAEQTGSVFYPELNYHNISYGGTTIQPQKPDNTFVRARRLVALRDSLPIDVVFMENVNDICFVNDDFSVDGCIDDAPWTPGEKMVGHSGAFAGKEEAQAWLDEHRKDIIEAVPAAKRKKGAMISLPYIHPDTLRPGTRVKLLSGALKDGAINMYREEWNFPVDVKAGMDVPEIASLMAVHGYGAGWTAIDNGDSSVTVAYCYIRDYRIIPDAGDTGVRLEYSESLPSRELLLYFTGNAASDWEDEDKWASSVSVWSYYKGLLDYLTAELPDTKFYQVKAGYHNVDYSDSTLLASDGSFDEKAYAAIPAHRKFEIITDIQAQVAALYGIDVIDIHKGCGITSDNVKEYYKSKDVHPVQAGYDRWSDALAAYFGF